MSYLLWLMSALIDLAVGAFLIWASIQALRSGMDVHAALGLFCAAFLAVRFANRPNFRPNRRPHPREGLNP